MVSNIYVQNIIHNQIYFLMNSADCRNYSQYTITVAIPASSDGFMNRNTQIMPSTPQNMVLKVSGVNHDEVKNTSNKAEGDVSKNAFEEIWRGEHGSSFHVDK